MKQDIDQPQVTVAEEVPKGSERTPRTVTFNMPTMPRPQFRRPPFGRLRSGVLAVIFLVLAVLAGYGGSWLQHHGGATDLTDQKKVATSESKLISQIANTVGPSVVSVNVDIATASSDSTLNSYYGYSDPSGSGTEQAAGTGIIIASSGLIMTNRHVVPTGTTKISITLSDGTELKDVSVLGRTNDSDSLDIAFLKVNNLQGHKLKAASIGDSANVQVGDNVVAIGNALGQFQNTVTSGIISGFGRSVQAGDSSDSQAATENLDDLFQTDAAINEGNSGGPLVNLNGQVIGLNTAIASDSQNIGFAIPVNDLRGLINNVIKTGKFQRPYLGVRYVPLTADAASQYGLKVKNGAYIAPGGSSPAIIAGSPAEKAGLQEKDIITAVGGTKIDQTHSLTSLLSQHEVGEKVSLTIVRGDKTLHLDATIGDLPTTASQ